MGSAPRGVLIVGGGLAGGLLALALVELGVSVVVVDPGTGPSGSDALSSDTTSTSASSASAISYGALPGWPLADTPLARLAASAADRWQSLERRHGALGWQRRRLRLQGERWILEQATRLWPLPFSQVDALRLRTLLPQRLVAAGVSLHTARVQALEASPQGDGWQLCLSDGTQLTAAQLVLAAGAACRDLWPALPQRLRCSWAAVLELGAFPALLGPPAAWLPQTFTRVALERRAAQLPQPEWLVDAGVVPVGGGALLGQHSLVGPGLATGVVPDPLVIEQQLRQGLAAQAWGARLAALPGCLLQAPVAFCDGGVPLVGPVSGAEGLWVFAGFSAGFSQVPVLAPLLAQCLASAEPAAGAAQQQLQHLGVWPAGG